jgi:CheY-like chemotaxis protein
MSTRTILFVDDEPDIRSIAAMALRFSSDWRVLTASGGAEALEVATREQPDAIVLDVMMPGMDGPATLARLRQEVQTRQTPVLFCTAKAQPAELRRLSDADVAGVLSKPFDPMALRAQIARALGWEDA